MKVTERGALTNCRQHKKGLVSIRKQTERATGTDVLETADGWTCQDTERMRQSEWYPLAGDGMGRNLSGRGNKVTERGVLTN